MLGNSPLCYRALQVLEEAISRHWIILYSLLLLTGNKALTVLGSCEVCCALLEQADKVVQRTGYPEDYTDRGAEVGHQS